MSGILAALAAGTAPPGVFATSLPDLGNAAPQSVAVSNAGHWVGGDTVGGATDVAWITPQSAFVAAFYQVKVDVTGGAFTTGDVTGSYLDCATTRGWGRTTAGTVTFNVTFREKGTGIVRKVYTAVKLIVS